MPARKIILSAHDCDRLRELFPPQEQVDASQSTPLTVLEKEIERAKVVAPEEVPRYVVTMNSCVQLVDTSTNERMEYTLVYPDEANPQEGLLSVLSDLGLAILGFCVGDTVTWAFPDGVRRLRINMIYFQPEATHQYDK